MKLHCETVAAKLLPTLRAMVAKELIDKYHMTQQQAATRLGITQSAISQYTRNLRGSKMEALEKDKVVSTEIDNFASKIASNQVKNESDVTHGFCVICMVARKRKII